MKKFKSITNARRLLRECELGVLSTHSKANEGYPFGSVSTYMSTVNGDVIFYVSDLAQHTKNINVNARMCLTVFSHYEHTETCADKDPNASARLSILGSASLLDDDELSQTKERFFTLYPDSRKYQATHDFRFYKLKTERVRFIGGFGDIHWVSETEWRLDTPKWLDSEQSMIEHMNEDHLDALQLMCEHRFGVKTNDVEMLLINPDGCFIKADAGKPRYIAFDEIAHDAQGVRHQLVALTNAARSALIPAHLKSVKSPLKTTIGH